MRKFSVQTLLLCFFGVAILLTSCRPEQSSVSVDTRAYDNKVATQWFEMFRTLTKKCPGFSPPVASRAFGYAGVALYEAVVPGMPDYSSLRNQLSAFNHNVNPDANLEYHWPLAANAAMAAVARSFYANMPTDMASQVDALEALMKSEYASVGDEVAARSEKFGQDIAAAVFEWSKTDGGHEGYLNNFPAFDVPVGEGLWVPTSPTVLTPLQAYWGNNRTFIPNCAQNTQPPAPIPFSTADTSVFYAQALQVYAVGNSLTTEQTVIAKFWSDDPGAPGTPPGHSISIATQVLNAEGASLDKAAETYCKVGIAVSDAFVSCWKCKYQHNLIRPVSYIREHINPTWTPILNTPPFPEFTSGHSVQSGAAAQVLSDLFGYNYSFTDYTHVSRTDIDGSPRAFDSFFDFADEAAISRLYGGIHYIEAIEVGVQQGANVGREVDKLIFRSF